jgi:HlyD family secretion protein
MEYLQQRNKVQKVEGKLQDAKADRQRQKGERELQRALADLRSKLIELNVTIRHLAIRAPEAGVVFELKPRARCFIALTSEPVMKVVPFDRPGARVEVPSREIGFVAEGKPGDISIDSLSASDFGVLQDVGADVAHGALPPDQIKQLARFPVDICLNSQQLKLRSGQSLPLQGPLAHRQRQAA